MSYCPPPAHKLGINTDGCSNVIKVSQKLNKFIYYTRVKLSKAVKSDEKEEFQLISWSQLVQVRVLLLNLYQRTASVNQTQNNY